MAVCYICGIGFGPSPTYQYSPNRTIPFSSNQITTTTLPRTKALSCFHHATTSVQPTFSFHCKTKTHFPFRPPLPASNKPTAISSAMSSGYVQEDLPPALGSTSDPPPIFDGTTREGGEMCYVIVNAEKPEQGLQDKIKLVPIDLKNRPTWYKENVYPPNKDPAKKQFADELLSYIDSFYKTVTPSFNGEGTEAGIAFDNIETALTKFEDGPFFLGQFSLVCDKNCIIALQ
ncbi:hypothetical protein Golax_000200 [Gossypium laxum]|uniref:Uncharacterized protein n=1 Tax=Gossypium laxum TaxID=34288 RepID=A0A7J9ASX0_9ROSI|nr:hypothetical protein [Gossypium laxum]